MEPMIIALLVIIILICYAIFQVTRMKRNFDSKGGSYDPLLTDNMKTAIEALKRLWK